MRRLVLVRHAPTAATRAAVFPADEPLDERGVAGAATLADRLPFAACAPLDARGSADAATPADRLLFAACAPLDARGSADAATPADRLPFAACAPLDEPAVAGGAAPAGRAAPRCELLCSPALRCLQTAAAAGLAEPRVEPALAECDFGSWAGRSLAEVDEADAGAWMTDPAATPHGGESLRAFAARVAGWLDAQARLDGRAVAIAHGGVVKAAVVHALGAPLDAFWRIDVTPLSITELHAHDGRWTVTCVNSMADSPRYSRSTRHSRARDGGEGGFARGEGAFARGEGAFARGEGACARGDGAVRPAGAGGTS